MLRGGNRKSRAEPGDIMRDLWDNNTRTIKIRCFDEVLGERQGERGDRRD